MNNKVVKIMKEIKNNPKIKIGGFEFPEKQELKLRLKDMLENEVDEKYYIKQEISDKLFLNLKDKEMNDCISGGKGSLDAKHIQGLCCVGMLDIKGNEQVRRVYADEGINPTLNTMQGGNRQPKILIKNATKQRYTVAEPESFIEKKYKEFIDKKGYMPEMFNPYNCQEVKDIAPTQTTICGCSTSSSTVLKNENHKIRKLTPLECWRLMGFKDEQFEKAEKVCSNSQLYKQAGNSIVVNVLEEIFKKMIEFGYIKVGKND